ncbi:glycosyltransferase [Azospirillum brasilense]|uniref:glycosyltransferase n=1 Tax=Azospirillum brasilense TaxID=192 RepID=UPI000E699BE5|nr:glycosyltransferase [Azospirillum brasilense]NUB28212.1 glycosyltransferase [Azospirillum brasilense]NUB35511.1 glycosyltransferase [Azospirillum brasilense]RIV97296.1 glycosyltransferase family 1 protein [Azospirillum brasilense]
MKTQKNVARQRRSFCFVSETGQEKNPLLDPSVRYRCYHPAEMLVANGNVCTVVSARQFFNAPLLNQDVYVFHRPNMARASFRSVTEGLRRNGAIMIADYDDLIFGTEDIALVSSAVKNGTLTEEKAIAAFQSNLAGLRQFDKVTTSTDPLAARVREFNPNAQVQVVPNFIPDSILSIHKELGTSSQKRLPTSIGYFAGTRSHDKDFPIVEAALHRTLSENLDFKLLVVGPVAVPRSIASLPNVNTAPVVNFLRLPALMSMCATVIAPLETSNFNNCKSRVKFLEAALAGCRLIATPIPDMKAIGSERLTLAFNTDDWYEALSDSLDTDSQTDLAKSNFAFLEAGSKIDGLEALAGLQ